MIADEYFPELVIQEDSQEKENSSSSLSDPNELSRILGHPSLSKYVSNTTGTHMVSNTLFSSELNRNRGSISIKQKALECMKNIFDDEKTDDEGYPWAGDGLCENFDDLRRKQLTPDIQRYNHSVVYRNNENVIKELRECFHAESRERFDSESSIVTLIENPVLGENEAENPKKRISTAIFENENTLFNDTIEADLNDIERESPQFNKLWVEDDLWKNVMGIGYISKFRSMTKKSLKGKSNGYIFDLDKGIKSIQVGSDLTKLKSKAMPQISENIAQQNRTPKSATPENAFENISNYRLQEKNSFPDINIKSGIISERAQTSSKGIDTEKNPASSNSNFLDELQQLSTPDLTLREQLELEKEREKGKLLRKFTSNDPVIGVDDPIDIGQMEFFEMIAQRKSIGNSISTHGVYNRKPTYFKPEERLGVQGKYNDQFLFEGMERQPSLLSSLPEEYMELDNLIFETNGKVFLSENQKREYDAITQFKKMRKGSNYSRYQDKGRKFSRYSILRSRPSQSNYRSKNSLDGNQSLKHKQGTIGKNYRLNSQIYTNSDTLDFTLDVGNKLKNKYKNSASEEIRSGTGPVNRDTIPKTFEELKRLKSRAKKPVLLDLRVKANVEMLSLKSSQEQIARNEGFRKTKSSQPSQNSSISQHTSNSVSTRVSKTNISHEILLSGTPEIVESVTPKGTKSSRISLSPLSLPIKRFINVGSKSHSRNKDSVASFSADTNTDADLNIAIIDQNAEIETKSPAPDVIISLQNDQRSADDLKSIEEYRTSDSTNIHEMLNAESISIPETGIDISDKTRGLAATEYIKPPSIFVYSSDINIIEKALPPEATDKAYLNDPGLEIMNGDNIIKSKEANMENLGDNTNKNRAISAKNKHVQASSNEATKNLDRSKSKKRDLENTENVKNNLLEPAKLSNKNVMNKGNTDNTSKGAVKDKKSSGLEKIDKELGSKSGDKDEPVQSPAGHLHDASNQVLAGIPKKGMHRSLLSSITSTGNSRLSLPFHSRHKSDTFSFQSDRKASGSSKVKKNSIIRGDSSVEEQRNIDTYIKSVIEKIQTPTSGNDKKNEQRVIISNIQVVKDEETDVPRYNVVSQQKKKHFFGFNEKKEQNQTQEGKPSKGLFRKMLGIKGKKIPEQKNQGEKYDTDITEQHNLATCAKK